MKYDAKGWPEDSPKKSNGHIWAGTARWRLIRNSLPSTDEFRAAVAKMPLNEIAALYNVTANDLAGARAALGLYGPNRRSRRPAQPPTLASLENLDEIALKVAERVVDLIGESVAGEIMKRLEPRLATYERTIKPNGSPAR